MSNEEKATAEGGCATRVIAEGAQAGVPVPQVQRYAGEGISTPANKERLAGDPGLRSREFEFVKHRRRGHPFDKLRAGSAVHNLFFNTRPFKAGCSHFGAATYQPQADGLQNLPRRRGDTEKCKEPMG